MVSAATGALLVPHVAAGTSQESLLYLCYAFFGMSLLASLVVITLIWSRLAHFGSSGSARVPTLWIVLGPVGRSITAAGALGTAAALALGPPVGPALDIWPWCSASRCGSFMLLWLPIAALLTVRARRQSMGFALTWWSFTFPVGTCVTGTSQLAHHRTCPCSSGRRWRSIFLLGAWVLVLVSTAGSLRGSSPLRWNRRRRSRQGIPGRSPTGAQDAGGGRRYTAVMEVPHEALGRDGDGRVSGVRGSDCPGPRCHQP